jgi:hypothetical protein
MVAAGVTVKGLKEFRREVKKLDNAKDINALLKDAHYRVAQSVIGPAQARAAGLGAMESRAAGTLRAARTVGAAKVHYGGVPWAFGAEFGANRNVPRGTKRGPMLGWNQFNPHRGRAGYFLYPTIKALGPRTVELYADELDRITRAAFPS